MQCGLSELVCGIVYSRVVRYGSVSSYASAHEQNLPLFPQQRLHNSAVVFIIRPKNSDVSGNVANKLGR